MKATMSFFKKCRKLITEFEHEKQYYVDLHTPVSILYS